MAIPAKIRKEIEKAIVIRAKAKAMESEAKILTAQAKETLLPIMTAYEIKDYDMSGIGKVMIKTNKGSNINATILRESLILSGIPLETVEDVITKSTKSWSSEYVEFKGSK